MSNILRNLNSQFLKTKEDLYEGIQLFHTSKDFEENVTIFE